MECNRVKIERRAKQHCTLERNSTVKVMTIELFNGAENQYFGRGFNSVPTPGRMGTILLIRIEFRLKIRYAFVGIRVVVNKNKTDLQENLHNLFTLCWLIC